MTARRFVNTPDLDIFTYSPDTHADDCAYIARDIAQLALTKSLIEYITSLPRFTSEKNTYEAQNIVERFLVALANEGTSSFSVYRDPSAKLLQKLGSELIEKFKLDAQTIMRVKLNVRNKIRELFERKIDPRLDFSIVIGKTDVYVKQDGEIIISQPKTARIAEMVREKPLETLKCIVRYEIMSPRGQQWAIPYSRRDISNMGIRLECFASPFNAVLETYCSAFYDTDYKFGSIGNFFDVDLDNEYGNIMLNPPFVEDIMTRAACKILVYLSQSDSRKFSALFTLPYWSDTPSVKDLLASPLHKYSEIKKRGTYAYICGDKKINASFDSIYIVVSNDSAENASNFVKKFKALREITP